MYQHVSKLFGPVRKQCLAARKTAASGGTVFGRREDTEHIRQGDWKAAPAPPALERRWVELTGPGNDAKMVINGMNCQANGYMLDLEDSMAPTPENVLAGHENIKGLVRGTLEVKTEKKTYSLNKDLVPTFMVRVRGLYLPHDEGSGMIYDICSFLEHNGQRLLDQGKGPFLYVPKLESYEEAVFVNSVISECEDYLGLPIGCTKVTVLGETFPAIFQTDEIIFALKDRIVGINCGRWDYLFSMIKYLPQNTFPDRKTLSMDQPYLEAYVNQIVGTCHQRGIHAMGGMSANIPSKVESENAAIVEKIMADKALEIARGCDGAWVAHPALIEPVQKLFEEKLAGANDQKHVSAALPSNEAFFPTQVEGPFSEECMADNLAVATAYTQAWLGGSGAVAINNLMEDLATAEISCAQIRNWVDQGVVPRDKVVFTGDASTNKILEKYVDSKEPFLYAAAFQQMEGVLGPKGRCMTQK